MTDAAAPQWLSKAQVLYLDRVIGKALLGSSPPGINSLWIDLEVPVNAVVWLGKRQIGVGTNRGWLCWS